MNIGWLDSLLHRLGIPWWRVCDAYDLSLGVPDTPENFPRRHGYVRLEHIYSGNSAFPDDAVCTRCGNSISVAAQCLLVSGAAEGDA